MTEHPALCAFPITPSEPDGSVDVAALRRLVAPLAGVDAIGLLGSTGTYPYLSRAARRLAVETAADEVAGRTPLLVGIGALRTDETVQLAQDAKAAGASAGLLAAVSYTPLTDEEVFEHFATVAREGRLPLVIYDNPTTTHFRFSAVLIGRLAALECVVAVKCPAPEPGGVAAHLADLRTETDSRLDVGYSVDWHAVEALIAGADAWYSVAGGLFPKACMAIVDAVRAGDMAEARRLNARMQPLWDLFTAFSSLRVMYAAADLLGLCTAAPPRPILPLSPAIRDRIAATLTQLELA